MTVIATVITHWNTLVRGRAWRNVYIGISHTNSPLLTPLANLQIDYFQAYRLCDGEQ